MDLIKRIITLCGKNRSTFYHIDNINNNDIKSHNYYHSYYYFNDTRITIIIKPSSPFLLSYKSIPILKIEVSKT